MQYICTTQGRIQAKTSFTMTYPCRPLPTLQPGSPVKPQDYYLHRRHPLTTFNVDVTGTELDLELKKAKGIHFTNNLMLCTSDHNLPAILHKYPILLGYIYSLPADLDEKAEKALLDSDYVFRRIQMDFTLGNPLPQFIGEITLEDLMQSKVLLPLLRFASQTKCPLFVLMYPHGQSLTKDCPSAEKDKLITNKYALLHQFQQLCSEIEVKSGSIINLPLHLHTRRTESGYSTVNVYSEQIQGIFSAGVLKVGFDLVKYTKQSVYLRVVGDYIERHTSKVWVESNITFKTDLKDYGGEGLSLGEEESVYQVLQPLRNQVQDCALRRSTMMGWRKQEEKVIQIKHWNCCECGSQHPETEEGFNKFNKVFCSMKCLKRHSFS